MLESSLDALDVVGWSSDVHFWVLRVFHAKSPSVLIVGFPSATHLREIATVLADRDAYLIVVEDLSVELEELS